MKKYLILSTIIALAVFCGYAKSQPKKEIKQELFQVKLFHISRSINKNIVVYEVNVSTKVKDMPSFCMKEPIKVYWILYEKKGEIQGLSALEAQMAYGFKVDIAKPDLVEFSMKPLPDRKIQVKFAKDASGYRPVAEAKVNNEDCYLTEVFISAKKAVPLPKVNYIDLKGISIKTGRELSERVTKK